MIELTPGIYNLHTHTQFCDGRASMQQMAEAAYNQGLKVLGFSPHGPLSIASPVNMKKAVLTDYRNEISRLRELYAGKMTILAGMELDFLDNDDFAKDYHDLDYRIGSVHFIPSLSNGEETDIDGHCDRFIQRMGDEFNHDIEYVVNRFFDRTLRMIEIGGIEIVGHLDKISRNADAFMSGTSIQPWFKNRVNEVIEAIESHPGLGLEINTKFAVETGRFFPAAEYWAKIKKTRIPVYINSDAHDTTKITSGFTQAYKLWNAI